MKPAYTLDQVRHILRRHFGASWEAGYAGGKQDMAFWLADRLKMSQETTARAVQEMERQGMLRFEPSGGVTDGQGDFGTWTVGEPMPAEAAQMPEQARA